MATKNYSPVVQELIDLIAKNGWEDRFQKALDACHALNTIEYENIKTLDDYYDWLEGELKWIPVENPEGTIVYEHVTMFYFLLDQSPVKELQTPIIPSKLKGNEEPPLTPLSQWMRKYVVSFGAWMDQPESLNDEAVKAIMILPVIIWETMRCLKGVGKRSTSSLRAARNRDICRLPQSTTTM